MRPFLCVLYCVEIASTLGLPLLSVVRPREDSNGTVSRDVPMLSERTSSDTVPLLSSHGRTTESKGRSSVEASVEMCVLAKQMEMTLILSQSQT